MATERMFVEPSIMELIASVSKTLHDYEHAGGFAPTPRRRRRKRFPRRPRPHHRQPVRAGKRPSPSRQKLLEPQPPAPPPTRLRLLSERRDRRRLPNRRQCRRGSRAG
jgi:hypothetical protein